MNIEEIKVIVQNNLNDLINLKGLAIQAGNLSEVANLDMQIQETTITLAKLN